MGNPDCDDYLLEYCHSFRPCIQSHPGHVVVADTLGAIQNEYGIRLSNVTLEKHQGPALRIICPEICT
jgi:hypothetical protein